MSGDVTTCGIAIFSKVRRLRWIPRGASCRLPVLSPERPLMKTISLGSSGPSVSNIALGMMRITDKTDDEIRSLYATAREAGEGGYAARGLT